MQKLRIFSIDIYLTRMLEMIPEQMLEIKMKKLISAFLLIVLSATQNVFASTREIASCIRRATCQKTFVVAHRSNGFGAPENSREAVEKATRAGVNVIEIDVRLSKDGNIYVMHDNALDKTTNLQGPISQKISVELEDAILANDETLPMLQDIHDVAAGKAILNLDFKSNAIEKIVKWIAHSESFDDFIFFVDTIEEMESAAILKTRYPEMIVMAREKSNISLEDIEKVFGTLPEIIHTDFPTKESVEYLHKKKVKVFANVLAAEKTFWPIKQLAEHWIFAYETDFIQTDYPKEWLKKLNRTRKSLEKKYNFGVVYSGQFFRSRAPSKKLLKYAKEHYGITAVIDLRNPNSANEDWRIEEEKRWAEELGLKYIQLTVISSSAQKYADAVKSILEKETVLIHCQAGKDRTGAVIAFLRMQGGWTYEEAIREMKKYGHNPKRHPGFHKHLKEFFRTLFQLP